jgi:uncharacterized membrane protein YesL
MSRFFSVDNKFFSTVNKIVDLLWLSFLWSLISLPMIFIVMVFLFEYDKVGLYILLLFPISVITVGPASAALYYAVVKSVRRERSYATKCFFHALKTNFKQGALSSVIFGLAISILLVDYFWATYSDAVDANIAGLMRGAFIGISVFVLFALVWVNPLLSRFELKFKDLIKNALILAIKNIFRTIIMAAFWVGLGYCFWTFFEYIFQYIVLIPFVLPGVSALLRSFVIEPIFKRITGDPNEDSDKEVDAWYAE